MLTFHLLFTGFVLGVILCLPLGPIGMLSVRRTMVYGEVAGVLTILGAAFADALYFFIAGYGIAQIPEFIEKYQTWFQFIGGMVLLIVGATVYFKKTPMRRQNSDKPVKQKSRPMVLLTSFLLMLSNPLPVLVFMATVSSLTILNESQLTICKVSLLTTGAFLGSAAWAPILVISGRLLHDYSKFAYSQWLNRISGIVIAIFGVALLVGLVFRQVI